METMTKTRKINPKTGPAWTEVRTWKLKTESYPDWQYWSGTLADLFADHARQHQRSGGEGCGVPDWYAPADGSTGLDRAYNWIRDSQDDPVGPEGIYLGRGPGQMGVMDRCIIEWCD